MAAVGDTPGGADRGISNIGTVPRALDVCGDSIFIDSPVSKPGEPRLRFCHALTKAAKSMPAKEILLEADKLHKVSDSLDLLAEQHAPISEQLSILSGTVRNSATLLRVLVALKLGPVPGSDPAPN